MWAGWVASEPRYCRAFDATTPTPGRCGTVVVKCLPVRLAAALGRGREKREEWWLLSQHLTGRTEVLMEALPQMSRDPAGR